jgi:hypothetical protein
VRCICCSLSLVVVSEGSFSEASARRFFIEESRRRVLSLLEDLHWFTKQHNRQPPGWTFERLAALAEQVGADDATTADLSDCLGAVEDEIRSALSEFSALLAVDEPIPYVVTQGPTTPQEPMPAPKPLRPFLTVLRGGA